MMNTEENVCDWLVSNLLKKKSTNQVIVSDIYFISYVFYFDPGYRLLTYINFEYFEVPTKQH